MLIRRVNVLPLRYFGELHLVTVQFGPKRSDTDTRKVFNQTARRVHQVAVGARVRVNVRLDGLRRSIPHAVLVVDDYDLRHFDHRQSELDLLPENFEVFRKDRSVGKTVDTAAENDRHVGGNSEFLIDEPTKRCLKSWVGAVDHQRRGRRFVNVIYRTSVDRAHIGRHASVVQRGSTIPSGARFVGSLILVHRVHPLYFLFPLCPL